MDTRRDFLKKAALLAGTAGYWEAFPDSIKKALEIDPATGTTYLDAEHVVILMQENRSFDHAYGSLQGVRGFDDPRAIPLPNGHPVWCQTDAEGKIYAPFRLNMKDTKATWMNSLPHTWPDQVDARNGGKHDGWLRAKASHNKEYARLPLTMGYYNREDLPFYYALADAFTICDQHFCSSLTGTTPNRLYLWTGTIREKPDPKVKANVRNEDVDYDHIASWKTFPERLEELDISWKIYQNELSLPIGLEEEAEAWLSNFGDNPIEWFEQYQAKFSPPYYHYLQKLSRILNVEINDLQERVSLLVPASAEAQKLVAEMQEKQLHVASIKSDLSKWSPEQYEQLSAQEKNLHEKAFTTNKNEPHYHHLEQLAYQEGGQEQQVAVPKGDILHQFRADVEQGTLPTVSWIVAPEKFSDHPTAPWYGAWYVSEVMDILTKNPKIWEKTVFILTYDENDGYFDHVPPFVAPHPEKPHTGLVSRDIDTSAEFVTLEQEGQRTGENAQRDAREGPIGLGFRVPMVVASPWSRGGRVCSEVFDHTSVLQFLENFLNHKTSQTLRETNITSWRRNICGNLTSIFRPYNGERYKLPDSLVRDEFVKSVHKAQFKPVPTGYKALTEDDVAKIKTQATNALYQPYQEKGQRPSNALPYELYVDGKLSADKKSFEIAMSAQNKVFGKNAVGAPFQVYVPGLATNRQYAVAPGDSISDKWQLADFAEAGNYHFQVYGPNGFFREFAGTVADPSVEILCGYQQKNATTLTGQLEITSQNAGQQVYKIEITDNAYQYPIRRKTLGAGKGMTLSFNLKDSQRWYDFTVRVVGFPDFQKRYAGRVENGEEGFTDPLIGSM